MRLHIFVSGLVQGVFFRKFTVDIANESGLTGWVKNTDDGKVEIMAEGDLDQFTNFIIKLKQGSEDSEVADFVVDEEIPTGEFKTFEKR